MGDAMLVAAAQDGEERVFVGLCIRDSARAFTGLRRQRYLVTSGGFRN